MPDGYYWETSTLYETGNVQLAPEPSTLILLAMAGIMMFFVRRRAC